jgi:Fe-S-cluster-containing dehydrogenase component
MNEFVLFFSLKRCSGCRRCELACSLQNAEVSDPSKAFIRILVHPRLGTPSLVLRSGCQGCATCVTACNLEALCYAPEEDWGDLLADDWIPVPLLPHAMVDANRNPNRPAVCQQGE